MNRRDFLKQTVSASGVILLPAQAQKLPGHVVVTESGADPTGKQDSTGAVLAAIKRIPREAGVLIFPKGTYTFAPSTAPKLSFDSLRGLTIEGNDSLLQFAGATPPFLFTDCSGLQLKNLRINWPNPPFSQGTVKTVQPGQAEILVDQEFQISDVQRIGAIGQYDRSTRLPSPSGIDSYDGVASVQKVGPQTLRLALSKPVPLKTGMTVVLRHQVYGCNAVTLRRCTSPHITHLTIYAAPGLGVLGLGCTDILIDHLTVAPPPGSSRLLSTCADASHFADCRGSLSLINCSFFGMGDDAVNAFASYWRVEESGFPGSYRVSGRGHSPIGEWQLPRPGDTLRFVDSVTMASLREVKVTSASLSGSDVMLKVQGSGQASVPNGSLVCNLDAAPRLSVSNSEFLGNRARGVVGHSNVLIEDNHFSGCSMSAVLLAPDAHWMEGPAVTNAVIRRNRFANCGYAKPNDKRGVISVDIAHDQHAETLQNAKINNQVCITDNTFGPTSMAAIYCSAVEDVSILHNTVSSSERQPGEPPIVLVNANRIQIRDNKGSGPEKVELRACAGVNVGANPGLAVHNATAP